MCLNWVWIEPKSAEFESCHTSKSFCMINVFITTWILRSCLCMSSWPGPDFGGNLVHKKSVVVWNQNNLSWVSLTAVIFSSVKSGCACILLQHRYAVLTRWCRLLCRAGAPEEGESQEEGSRKEGKEVNNLLFCWLKYFNIMCSCLFNRLCSAVSGACRCLVHFY